tara:strand:+ start:147 stop:401 length:255 start_codon:yes stop_codon:yes gene_type:complete
MGSILDIMPGDVLVMVAQMLVQNGASDSSPKKIFKEDICWIALSKYSMHRTQSVHVKKRHLLTDIHENTNNNTWWKKMKFNNNE